MFRTLLDLLGLVNSKSGSTALPEVEAYISKEKDSSDDAARRKWRSITRLKAERIPVYELLPRIESEADSTRRSTDEVAQRAIALCVVAMKGEGIDRDSINRFIKDYDCKSAFTFDERQFILDPNPRELAKAQFSWRYECYWVMLWALGFVDKLDFPKRPCNVRKAVKTIRKLGLNGFSSAAKLRPQCEILDAADLIYRYHWAVTDARINNRKTPGGLDSGVVMERHHALNWLVGYCDQEWDDITTDT